MSETRNMLKQLNESLLIDIKENFKKNLTKIENDQKGKQKNKNLIKNMTIWYFLRNEINILKF